MGSELTIVMDILVLLADKLQYFLQLSLYKNAHMHRYARLKAILNMFLRPISAKRVAQIHQATPHMARLKCHFCDNMTHLNFH
jgi:hypothetical protein